MKNKLLLFLILFSFIGYSQNPTRFQYGVKITGGQPTVTGVNYLTVTDDLNEGLQSKIAPINVPIPYTPINYSISGQTIGQQIAAIDAKIGTMGTTSAGVTQRVYFTADNTVVNSVTYFASSLSGKGSTASGSPPALVLPDNTKAFFTKDVISVAQPSTTIGYAGTYSGNLTVSATPTPVATKQRFTVEIYRTNNLGTPIASGVSGAPVGDLGVTVLAILDSGELNLTAGSITNVLVEGRLTQNVTINTGERLRYHVSAAKIGTGGGSVTFGVYYGTSYNSYYDIPVAITTDAVLDRSDVPGAVTTTDALNYLKTTQDAKLNKTYVSNYDVADNSGTISGSTFDAFGFMAQSLTNKIFIFYREGEGHISPIGKIAMRTSTDGGKTFSARTIIAEQVGQDYRNVGGGVTPTGRIIVFFAKYQNPNFLDQGIIYSDNDGATWSSFQSLPHADTVDYSPYGKMITIANGRLALPWYGVKTDGTSSVYLKFSDDNGATWSSDTTVGSALTNGYHEASYAYLDGGVILCVSGRVDGLKLRQFISTDNGQTWTNQGDISSANMYNVAPALNVYTESNGEKYVALFSSLRGGPFGVDAKVASKTSVISGVSGWLSESIQQVGSATNSDCGYPSVINPRQGKKMLGFFYDALTNSNPLSAIANLKLFNYTPSVVVPAMSNSTTSFLQKKTGFQSLSDSKIYEAGIGATLNGGAVPPSAVWDVYAGIDVPAYALSGYPFVKFSTGDILDIGAFGATWSGVRFMTNNVDRFNINSSGVIKISDLAGTVTRTVVTLSDGSLSAGDAVVTGVKRYKALISQTGTSAPTVNAVLENSLGTVSFSYSDVGNFQVTSSALFTTGKTFRFIGQGANANALISLDSANSSTMNIWVKEISTSTYVNGMSNIPILIEVYP